MTAASQAKPSPETTTINDYTRAMLNLLEDFTEEKTRLEETQSAILNILEDFGGEKKHFEETQRAASKSTIRSCSAIASPDIARGDQRSTKILIG